jgi:uncharacterized C2H2 Zn-finger protein
MDEEKKGKTFKIIERYNNGFLKSPRWGRIFRMVRMHA